MIRNRAETAVSILVGLVLTGCASDGASTASKPERLAVGAGKADRQVFRVALFPWIPDAAEDEFASLRNRLEEAFESSHPEIDLELRLIPFDDSYYQPARVAGWLASGQYDLVEIDTVILGDLIAAQVLEPWPDQDASRFFRAATDGASIVGDDGNRVWWGIPHLLCGFFIVSRSSEIDGAGSLDELVGAVERTGLPLLGNFESSWDLPTLYLDSRVDNGLDPSELKEAVRPPLEAAAASAVDRFAGLCETDGANPCVDGTYSKQWDAPVKRFVAGEAAGFWGYSERLHLTLELLRKAGASADGLRVASIPLGSQATPLLFTDAFVRRKGCEAEAACDSASTAFVDFINGAWALEEVLLSGDAAAVGKEAIPRYLLPATRAAFEIEGIARDPLFGELRPFAESGYALPNLGELYERRRTSAWLLSQELAN